MKPGATEWKDIWGVPYVSNAETGFAGIPKPNDFILKDITKWHEVIKRPDIPPANTFDWEKLAKEGTARINRETTGVISMLGGGIFQMLIGFMGFTEGLCALIEEPEACEELFDFIMNFYEPYDRMTIEYFKPDIVYLLDDTANKKDFFFNHETFRKLFKPFYARATKLAVERGIPVQLHNCGRCEDLLQDYIDVGVVYWDPAQTCNDLLADKEKFKGKMVFVGGYDFIPPADKYNQVSEEYVRQTVRDTIDKYAPGGQYAWLGGYLGRADELDRAAQINTWINEEVDTYGMTFYKK